MRREDLSILLDAAHDSISSDSECPVQDAIGSILWAANLHQMLSREDCEILCDEQEISVSSYLDCIH